MKTVNFTKQKLAQSVQPVSVNTKEWETAKFWAIEAEKSMSKGQFWSHKVVVPHVNCITWFMNQQGECTLGNWSFLEVVKGSTNVEILERSLEEFASQKEWLDAADVAVQLSILKKENFYFLQAGKLFTRAGLLKAALQILDAGLKHFPNVAVLYAVKSEVFQKLGWIDQAISQLDTALAFEPITASLWRSRAELQWRLGQKNAALRSLKHACELPTAELKDHQFLANILLKVGDIEQARGVILSIQRVEPTNGMNWLLLARLASATNESVRFIKEYYHIAHDLGIENAQAELDYFLVRQVQKAKKKVAA